MATKKAMESQNRGKNKKEGSSSQGEPFFLNEEVEKGCDDYEEQSYKEIEIRFETLINANCERPFDWYKDLELDKSYASRVRRGLIIPPKWLRIKIAQYFKTDSATIWTISDRPYIRKLLTKQKESEKK